MHKCTVILFQRKTRSPPYSSATNSLLHHMGCIEGHFSLRWGTEPMWFRYRLFPKPTHTAGLLFYGSRLVAEADSSCSIWLFRT